MLIAFHRNLTQPHQIEHGEWLKEGFSRHGLRIEITSDIHREADVHIVSGPHYAKSRWIGHPSVIWLDKRLYRDEPKPPSMASDPCVSLGWMTPTGSRVFYKGTGRPKLNIEPTHGEGAIYLCQYGESAPNGYDTVRRHPLDETPREDLREALKRHKKAVGKATTSLITAALMGLEIECLDPDYILNQPDWLEVLPYADWRYDEFDKAIEHLWQQR